MTRDAVERAFECEVGRRLAETTHRFFGRLVGQYRDWLVLDRADAVRSADRGHRFAELERRASGVRADVVERADFQCPQSAVAVEGNLHVEYAVRTVHVSAAHVLEPVFDQPHRHAKPLREIGNEHRVLDAALNTIAAAHIDIVMHAHCIAGQAQRACSLIGKFRHLNRRPDVEHLQSRLPLRSDAECLDGYRRAASPHRAQSKLVFRGGKRLVDRAPHKVLVQNDVGAMRGMNLRAAGFDRNFRIDDVRRRLVLDFNPFDRIFGDGARIRYHRCDPLAGVAHDVTRE